MHEKSEANTSFNAADASTAAEWRRRVEVWSDEVSEYEDERKNELFSEVVAIGVRASGQEIGKETAVVISVEEAEEDDEEDKAVWSDLIKEA